MTIPLAPPKNISPTIRFFRWTSLLGGIVYARMRWNYLSRKEVGIQSYENKMREERRIRLKKEKDILDVKNIEDLQNELKINL
ncbi:hypothetical protein A3Q56_01520 [Intoshia linei]|uniref:ATP synthase F(0) complex subunit e, mitochondrial n=1 Tax=Intoshia linei TaxID=1819745 RepID=A0A177BBA4_9BILA|nr:hypothetical protein A3Q56_01520 [Intoshia linei]